MRAAEAVQQAVPGLQRRPRQRRRPLHRVNQRAHVLLVRAGPAGSTCAGVVKAGRAGALLATLAERAVRFVCTATTTYANISQHPRIRQRARNSFLCRNPTHREPPARQGAERLWQEERYFSRSTLPRHRHTHSPSGSSSTPQHQLATVSPGAASEILSTSSSVSSAPVVQLRGPLYSLTVRKRRGF